MSPATRFADPPAHNVVQAETAGPVLEVRDVRFVWPGGDGQTVSVSGLTLGAGESVFLHGPSGCGKSTLLSMCAGVLLADTGRVALLGQDWRDLGAAARDRRRADHVGYIFQQFNLLPYATVLDNVLLPCRFSARRAARCEVAADVLRRTPAGSAAGSGDPGSSLKGEAAWMQEAARLLSSVGLPESAWRRPAAHLSVGQQQRVAAVRALIGQPELVIADEPTSALDAEHCTAFMDLLRQCCEASGTALLFVSHDARLASAFGRRVDLRSLRQEGAS